MQKPNNELHYQWQINLSKIKQKFTSIKHDNASITNKNMIQQLNNQLVKADYVLVGQFLQSYSNKQQLAKACNLQEIQSFYKLLKQNYSKVEHQYLNQIHNQNEVNYQTVKDKNKTMQYFDQNKNNLSKYIKDEHQLYLKVLNQNLAQIQNDQQVKGLNGQQVISLLERLLDQSKYIKVYKNGQQYFKSEKYSQEVNHILKNYICQVKNVPLDNFLLSEHYIDEDQILEFLTYWLKDQNNISSLYIVYARTQRTFINLEKKYMKYVEGQNEAQIKQSLEKYTNQFHKLQQEKQANSLQNKEENTVLKPQNSSWNQRKKSKSTLQHMPAQNILNKIGQCQQNGQIRPNREASTTQIRQQDQLYKNIPQLFKFGCKHRTKTIRGITFDQIHQQSQVMNLQKFINLCKYLQISTLLSRQTLIQEFKDKAINRLTLNAQKFHQLIKRLVLLNNQVLGKLLDVEKLPFLKKRYETLKVRGQNVNALSRYIYHLRPVNGRDVQSVQIELKEKKRLKQQVKKQKCDTLFQKKQESTQKYYSIKNNKTSQDKLVRDCQNESFRDLNQNSRNHLKNKQRVLSQKFNPQSLISDYGEDKLWEEYLAKVWKKDTNFGQVNLIHRNQSANQSILEEALSKRISRGQKVLKKIASTNLKYYL